MSLQLEAKDALHCQHLIIEKDKHAVELFNKILSFLCY